MISSAVAAVSSRGLADATAVSVSSVEQRRRLKARAHPLDPTREQRALGQSERAQLLSDGMLAELEGPAAEAEPEALGARFERSLPDPSVADRQRVEQCVAKARATAALHAQRQRVDAVDPEHRRATIGSILEVDVGQKLGKTPDLTSRGARESSGHRQLMDVHAGAAGAEIERHADEGPARTVSDANGKGDGDLVVRTEVTITM